MELRYLPDYAPENDQEPEGFNLEDLDPKEETLDLALIDDIEFEDVDLNDYPDFCDSYISSATYNGVQMTDDQLAELNEKHPGFVYERLFSKLF